MTDPARDYGPLLRALSRVGDDLKANAPLPPPETMTAADARAALERALAKAETITAWLTLHPGVYWALRHVLTPFAALRFRWAIEALAALKAVPGELATAHIWLPRIVGVLKATQPVGGPGSLDFENSPNFKNR